MRHTRHRLALALFLPALFLVTARGAAYEPTWESLSTHPIPEWFRDAKFGIYAHLGVYCVPAYDNEWYPRRMYREDDKRGINKDRPSIFEHHRQVYGDQARFGYKDLIPLFKLEKFDAAAWAQLYQDAGARFAGPVAEHHDGFSMWASRVNRWNAGAMGPQRDIVGELVREIRKRGMKVITSFHHSHNHNGDYYQPRDWDAAKARGWDITDPAFGDLYGHYPTPERSMDVWLAKLKEVIDAYQPDQIWFDFGLRKIPDSYKQRFAAYYYNQEARWGKSVIITRKGDHLPEGVGVLDIERGRMKDMGAELWQTDDSTARNSWCWVEGLQVKPTEEVLHVLIDIVSKNGVLLLNVCPQGDGTISADQQQVLRGMGAWLKVNGEAIYATRPWKVLGEGPTRLKKGGGFLASIQYTGRDIRYTRSKDGRSLYAICLGWPEGNLTLQSPVVRRAAGDAQVTLLGHGPVPFRVLDDHVVISVPSLSEAARPCRHAYAFKLQGFTFDVDPFARGEVVTLNADRAVIEGDQLNVEEKAGRPNLGFWDRPADSAHWLVRVPQAGTYRLRAETACPGGQPVLVADVAGHRARIPVSRTAGFERPAWCEGESLVFDRPGIYHLTLRPADATAWHAVNLWQLQLARVP